MEKQPVSKTFKGTFGTPSGDEIVTKLFVMMFVDDGSFVAYCPALRIYGYGATEEEAKSSFEVCIDEFFRYTLNKGTLFVDLEQLGWKCKNKKRIQPPSLSYLIATDQDVSDIWNHKSFQKFDKSITIPAAC